MEAIVETPQGRVRGALAPPPAGSQPVHTFRGIPYAAAPVGPLRFRGPEPAPSWIGDRYHLEFGPSPLQSKSSMFAGGLPGNQVGEMSEDCLTLNVWVPTDPPPPGGRAVMFWVYGGAYLTGGTSIETYDGVALASTQDVIVVSANYRLGFLGFGWPAGGDANVGLRDQLAALRWVHDHIEAFGGDQSRITVFGESAGAGSLLHLISSPAAHGFMRRAILQSPGVEHTLLPNDAAAVAAVVVQELGLADADGARLWDVPADVIIDAQERAFPALMGSVGSMPFHPVVDGDFLPAKPGVTWAAPDIDLLVSWTADEMRLYPNLRLNDGGRDRLHKAARRLINKRLGAEAGSGAIEALSVFYEDTAAGTTRMTSADLWAAMQTDVLMRLPARRLALGHARSNAVDGRTFVAQFDWRAAGGEWDRGAFHAVDLPFTFSTLDRGGWREFLGADRAADALVARHMDAWGAFARDGDPGWPAIAEGRVPTKIFGVEDDLADDPLATAARAWEGLWSADGPPPA